jgi:hypothetical protein
MACSLREPALHLLDGWGELWVTQQFQEHLREGLLTPQSSTLGYSCCCRCKAFEGVGGLYVVVCLNTELASPAAAAVQDFGVRLQLSSTKNWCCILGLVKLFARHLRRFRDSIDHNQYV